MTRLELRYKQKRNLAYIKIFKRSSFCVFRATRTFLDELVMWRKTVNQYHQFMWRQPLKKIAIERKRQLWRGTYMLPFNLLNSFYCKLISANNLCKMRNFSHFIQINRSINVLLFYLQAAKITTKKREL